MKKRAGSDLTRREFLQRSALAAGGAAVLGAGCSGDGGGAGSDAGRDGPGVGDGKVPDGRGPDIILKGDGPGKTPPGPLIFIAIDGLHPGYLTLDAGGKAGGSAGNWLMPGARALLEQAAWYTQGQCYLPSATDMNHLNAVAGTSSAQTGVNCVSSQMMGWDSSGKALMKKMTVDMARDDLGRKVDTLFHAWKRAWPSSKTAYISGKGWVAEMYRMATPVVDTIVTGEKPPAGLAAPVKHSFTDPPGDKDAKCDPESLLQTSYLTAVMEGKPEIFPPDSWVVDAALKVFNSSASPELAYILLAQTDDCGHALGAGWDPAEFSDRKIPYLPPAGCTKEAGYQLVSGRNAFLYREPMLDAIRDADTQLVRLVAGLKQLGVLAKATVVLLSDHSMITHVVGSSWAPGKGFELQTDYHGLIKAAGYAGADDVMPVSACSFAELFWRDGKSRVAGAKTALLAHTAQNPQTGKTECPWWVLDRADMKNGVAGVCLPGELYHKYFVDSDLEKTIVWPDLVLLSKNGWQLPVYDGMIGNLGVELPVKLPPLTIFAGGHGSVDTRPIVMGISTPARKGKVLTAAGAYIADLAVTAASLHGLKLQSTTVGKDRSGELG